MKLLVCDPRKNASMREGNQSDKIDARRLAELSPQARTGVATGGSGRFFLLLAQFRALEFVGDTSLKITLMPRSEFSCVVRTRSNSFRPHASRVPLGKR